MSIGDNMKFGEMKIDVNYSWGNKKGFFEKKKEAKEGKRIFNTHQEYQKLKNDKNVKNEDEFYQLVLYSYMVDCILNQNPELKEKYQEIYERCKKNNGYMEPYYWATDEFLLMYSNPELYEKNLRANQQDKKVIRNVAKRQDEIKEQQDLSSGKRVICPYCKSTNTEKISTVSRAVSVSLVGAASGKIGKQWHCKNCGSNF